MLHAKSLNTERAWAVYDELVETYFRAKAGFYAVPVTYADALRRLADQVENNERLQLESKQKDQIIGELKPKADYLDRILKSTAGKY